MKKMAVWCAGAMMWFALGIMTSAGAEPGGFSQPDLRAPGERNLPPLEFMKPAPGPEFTLPPPKLPAGQIPRISSAVRIFIKNYIFDGNQALSDAELSVVAQPFLNRVVSSDELFELKNRLTRHYIERGYLTSGVMLPDQKIVDQTVTFQVVEGRLSEIHISGNHHLADWFVRERLVMDPGAPLNIDDLKERIQVVHQNQHIDKLDARLRPGATLGESILDVDVHEHRRYSLGCEVNNHHSPSIGSVTGELYSEFRDLTGWGDMLGAKLDFTEGLTSAQFYFTIPVTSRDTLLQLQYETSAADVVEEPFDEIDIESESETLHVSIKHPLCNTVSHQFFFTLALEYRRSKTWLLGEPFSFSEGVEDGESTVVPIRLSLDWQHRRLNQVVAARSTLTIGTPLFDATEHAGAPDGQFYAWLGQFQWARRYENFHNVQTVLRCDVQLTPHRLLSQEKFSIGGADTVRGYREKIYTRDNGVVASLEGRIPVFNIKIPGVSRTVADGDVELAAFFDWGWAENDGDDGPADSQTIYSAGVGLRWHPSRNWHAHVYWAHNFEDYEETSADLQNDGVHFSVGWNY